ncbi:MAG: hypothetical protein JJE03_02860 [Peptostreptococcaceae bacterium]|nr:hypothetical protein [Peptostreptococcaceae bacterium]
MLTRSEAKTQIVGLINSHDAIIKGVKIPIRKDEKFDVYSIPIDYLVPNVINDRLAWRIREFEAEEGVKLSNEKEEHVEFVYGLISDEHPSENKKTKKDLAIKGQEEYGIITNNGIIIDGNRRATLLRELFNGEATAYNKNVEEFRCFKCVVLKEDVTEDEISSLETLVQIGKDEKVPYNPINMYIKIDNLFNLGKNYSQISNLMQGRFTEKDIENKHKLYAFMVNYLDAIGKPDHFTLLEGLEDPFIKTNNMIDKLKSKSYAAEWDYTDEDIDDFTQTCFDYMRTKYEGKEYRSILLGGVNKNKENGVFIDEKVWKDFYENHSNIIDAAEAKGKLNNEHDWSLLKPNFQRNLSNANSKLVDILADKNVSDLLNIIEIKISKLEDIVDKKEDLTEANIESMKLLGSRLYKVWKQFE